MILFNFIPFVTYFKLYDVNRFIFKKNKNITLYIFQMATGMVVSTFLSCPVMFISARLMTLPVTTEATFRTLIQKTAQDISIVGLISCVSLKRVFLLIVPSVIVHIISRKPKITVSSFAGLGFHCICNYEEVESDASPFYDLSSLVPGKDYKQCLEHLIKF